MLNAIIAATMLFSAGAKQSLQYLLPPTQFQQACGRHAADAYEILNSGKCACISSEDFEKQKIYSNLWLPQKYIIDEKRRVLFLQFTHKDNASPSDALIDFIEKGGAITCHTATDVVVKYIRLERYGEDVFDLWRDSSPLKIPTSSSSDVYIAGRGTPVMPGDFGCITNVIDHGIFQPYSIYNGKNLHCVDIDSFGEPLYLGFDPEFFDKPKTLKEIHNKLYEETIKDNRNYFELAQEAVFKMGRLYKKSNCGYKKMSHEEKIMFRKYLAIYDRTLSIIVNLYSESDTFENSDKEYLKQFSEKYANEKVDEKLFFHLIKMFDKRKKKYIKNPHLWVEHQQIYQEKHPVFRLADDELVNDRFKNRKFPFEITTQPDFYKINN